ncbi:MAG: GxxExxY protein [Chloroflexi bacterium]|nr:GxxExxY protein [Chloroflexota bacterium]
MTELLHKGLTGAIIGAYYEVYNHTSCTYPEYIYERAMLEELRQRGIQAIYQEKYQILYKDHLVGLQQLDLFVVQEVVVENKVARQLTSLHKAQCFSYVKTVDKSVGLLFNFGGPEPEFSRIYFNPAKKPFVSPEDMVDKEFPPLTEWLYPDLAYQIVGGLYEVHTILGAGFVYRIYANACYHELGLRGLSAKRAKRMQVAYKGTVIGDVAFAHILVEGKIMIFPVALHHIQDIRLDDLKRWIRLCDIQLGIVANFDAVHLEIVFVRA